MLVEKIKSLGVRAAAVAGAVAVGVTSLAGRALAGDTFTSVQASADALLADTNDFVLHMIWKVFGYVVVIVAIGLVISLVYMLIQKVRHASGGGK